MLILLFQKQLVVVWNSLHWNANKRVFAVERYLLRGVASRDSKHVIIHCLFLNSSFHCH